MKLNDFINVMDGIAPRELAMDWDNPGLLIGTEKQDIKKVLVALDCSMATAKEAAEWGARPHAHPPPGILQGSKAHTSR